MRMLHERRSGSARSVGRSRALKCYTVTDAAGDVEVVARDPVHAVRMSGKQNGRVTLIQPWNYASIDAIRSYLHGGARLPQGAELAGGEVVVPPLEGFVTVWRTTGVNETITLPLSGTGYNAIVNWGDGTADSIITTNTDVDRIHTYATAGDHIVTITGTFPRIYFNNTGDRFKLIKILNWGAVGWASGGLTSGFYGCSNLTDITATDANNMPGGSYSATFRGCLALKNLNLTGHPGGVTTLLNFMLDCQAVKTVTLPGFVTAATTTISTAFKFCYLLDTLNGLETWDTQNVTNTGSFLYAASVIPSLNLPWNMAKVTVASNMFFSCPLLASITGLNTWVTTALNDAVGMFSSTPLLNPSVAHFDVRQLAYSAIMFNEPSGFSDANYDALLIAWAAQSPNLKPAVTFGAGGAKYSAGAATTARGVLTGTHSWAITDGGPAALTVFEDMQHAPEDLLTRIPTTDVWGRGWKLLSGSGTIGNNALVAGVTGLAAHLDTGIADVIITCTVQAFAEVGIMLRGEPAGNNYVQVLLRPDGKLYLELVEPHVVLVESVPVIEVGDTEPHHLQVYSLGHDINIYFDGVLLIEAHEVFNHMNTWHGVKGGPGAKYINAFAIAAHP